MSRGRRRRKRAALALAEAGTIQSPVLLSSWDRCHQLGPWVPDLNNAHLKDAARGLSSIGLPHHPPAPVA